MYVPDISSTDPCRSTIDDVVPRKAVRRRNLPPANYNLIAIAPWINETCTDSFLASARVDPLRAFIFYKPTNDSDSPLADSDEWDLHDGDHWKSQNHFPVLAISGLAGQAMMHQLSLYSGNLTEVPYGDNITSIYDSDADDYVRIWTQIYVSTSSNIPSIWVLVLVVLGILLGIIGVTSLVMHLLQGRRRSALRRRVESGRVNLEGMGIKRLTVPIDHIQKFPLFTYSYEPETISTPVSPASPRSLHKPSRKGSRGRPSSIATTALPISEKGLDSPFALSTTATDYQPVCQICLDAFQNRVTVIRELPCGHIFHPECIEEFLSGTSSLCPICKACVLPRGYCPKITNAMVRRERAIRRLRDRTDVEDSEADNSGGMFHGWGSEIKKRIFSKGSNNIPNSSSTSTELQVQRRSTATESPSVAQQPEPAAASSSSSRARRARARMQELAGSELDDEEARLTRRMSTAPNPKRTNTYPMSSSWMLILEMIVQRMRRQVFPGF